MEEAAEEVCQKEAGYNKSRDTPASRSYQRQPGRSRLRTVRVRVAFSWQPLSTRGRGVALWLPSGCHRRAHPVCFAEKVQSWCPHCRWLLTGGGAVPVGGAGLCIDQPDVRVGQVSREGQHGRCPYDRVATGGKLRDQPVRALGREPEVHPAGEPPAGARNRGALSSRICERRSARGVLTAARRPSTSSTAGRRDSSRAG